MFGVPPELLGRLPRPLGNLSQALVRESGRLRLLALLLGDSALFFGHVTLLLADEALLPGDLALLFGDIAPLARRRTARVGTVRRVVGGGGVGAHDG